MLAGITAVVTIKLNDIADEHQNLINADIQKSYKKPPCFNHEVWSKDLWAVQRKNMVFQRTLK
jgi:hypothetical protein